MGRRPTYGLALHSCSGIQGDGGFAFLSMQLPSLLEESAPRHQFGGKGEWSGDKGDIFVGVTRKG